MRKRVGLVSASLVAVSCIVACHGSVGEIVPDGRYSNAAGSKKLSSNSAGSADAGSFLQNSQGRAVGSEPDSGEESRVGYASTLRDASTPGEMPLALTRQVRFEPAGGTFLQSVSLRLRAGDPESAIYYTLDGSVPDETSERYSSAIELKNSTIVRAFSISDTLGRGETEAASFTRIDEQLALFSTNLPLLLIQSKTPAPSRERRANAMPGAERDLVGLNVFTVDTRGRSSLQQSPQVSARAGLKLRGSSSSGFAKSPFSLEYWSGAEDDDVEKPMLDLPEESDWVLTPPYVHDRALIRNAVVYALSNNMGRYAPRTRFVELFFADKGEVASMDHYRGVYVVTEKIKRDGGRLDLAVLDSRMGLMPEVSGGYIFKIDRLGSGESGLVAGQAGGAYSLDPLAFVYPKEERIAPAQETFLKDYLDECAEALASSDYRSPRTGVHYSELIDIPSFIDHHILSVLTKNPDSLRLSSYFHKDRLGKLQAGPVWDFDRAMNPASDRRAMEPTWWDASLLTDDTTAVFEFGWWRSLFDDPQFTAVYWARFKMHLAGPLSEAAIVETIDSLSAQLTEAAPRNFDRWPEVAPRGGSHQSEVKLLKDWFKTRLEWIAECLQLPDPEACEGAQQQAPPARAGSASG